MEKTMHKGRKHKQQGGYLEGPLHENGGIPAIISGGEEVELEGGEYIINAQTVDALGTQFLDKINSTATTYHTGGFGAGELSHHGSNYAKGGKIRRNNMRKRKFAMGARINCPSGMTWINGQCMNVTPPPPPNIRRRHYHAGGPTQGPDGGWGYVMPHDHPHSIGDYTSDPYGGNTGQGFQTGPGGTGWNPLQNVPGALPRRPRLLKKPGISPLPPGMPPPRIPDIYRRGGGTRKYYQGGRMPYQVGPRPKDYTMGRNPYRRGGGIRFGTGGGVHHGSPNSCTNGSGRNVPC